MRMRPPTYWFPVVTCLIVVAVGLGFVQVAKPAPTSGEWSSAVLGVMVVVAGLIAVLIALGFRSESPLRRRAMELIPALATIPSVLILGATVLRSATLNERSDAYFHLKQTLRFTGFPLPWEANAFSLGYGSTYPWYWHAVSAVPVRLFTMLGFTPEKAFVLNLGLWAMALPLCTFLLLRLVTRSQFALIGSAATLLLVGTLDTYKLWSFVIAVVIALVAVRVWTGSQRWVPLSALVGLGIGFLFGWYTTTAVATGFGVLAIAIALGFRAHRVAFTFRALGVMAMGFVIAVLPFVLSARTALSGAATSQMVIEENLAVEQPYTLGLQSTNLLFAILIPSLIITAVLLATRYRRIAIGLLAISAGCVAYTVIDMILPAEYFHARIAIVPAFALFMGMLWGTGVLVHRGVAKARIPASVNMSRQALAGWLIFGIVFFPLQIAANTLVNSTLREGGHPDFIEKTFITQDNPRIVQIAEQTSIPLLAIPAPQVAVSSGTDISELLVGSDWSIYSPSLVANSPVNAANMLITKCEELHKVFTEGFSQRLDLALVTTAKKPVYSYSLIATTPEFHASSENPGPTTPITISFPDIALCPELFTMTEVLDGSLLAVQPK